MRVFFASMKMSLSYNEEQSVKIKRFPTRFETEELNKSKYALVDEKTYISDNELEIKIFYNTRRKHVDVRSGGNFDFKHGGNYGVDIDIHLRQPESKLIRYIANISKELCEKHLKKCICFPSKYSVKCEIDRCELSEEKTKIFLKDFIEKLEDKIHDFKVTDKFENIDESAEEIVEDYESKNYENCSICGGRFTLKKLKKVDSEDGRVLYFCPSCNPYPDVAEKDEINTPEIEKEGKKLRFKWKAIIAALTLLGITALIYLIGKIFNIF